MTIEGARADLLRFRNIEPPVYNVERLYEQPIPEFVQENALNAQENESNNKQTDGFDSTVVAEFDRSQTNSSSGGNQTNSNDSIRVGIPNASVATTNGNMNFVDGRNERQATNDVVQEQEEDEAVAGSNAIDDEIEVDVKPLVPLYEVANNNEILNQIEEHETFNISDSDSEDDIEIKVGPKGFGKPLNTIITPDGLFKRETPDEISGDMPFIEKVRTKHF